MSWLLGGRGIVAANLPSVTKINKFKSLKCYTLTCVKNLKVVLPGSQWEAKSLKTLPGKWMKRTRASILETLGANPDTHHLHFSIYSTCLSTLQSIYHISVNQFGCKGLGAWRSRKEKPRHSRIWVGDVQRALLIAEKRIVSRSYAFHSAG